MYVNVTALTFRYITIQLTKYKAHAIVPFTQPALVSYCQLQTKKLIKNMDRRYAAHEAFARLQIASK